MNHSCLKKFRKKIYVQRLCSKFLKNTAEMPAFSKIAAIRRTLIGQGPMKLVLSVRPSLRFLKIRSLVFSDIIQYDSWTWYLATYQARFLKKNWWPKFGPNAPKSGTKWVFFFCRLIEIGSYVFLKISYNDNLQQCLTSSRGKTQEKILGVQIWTKRAKIAPVITFFAIFSSLLQVYIIFSRYCTWSQPGTKSNI